MMRPVRFTTLALLAISWGAGGGDCDGWNRVMVVGRFCGWEMRVSATISVVRGGRPWICEDGDGVRGIEEDIEYDAEERGWSAWFSRMIRPISPHVRMFHKSLPVQKVFDGPNPMPASTQTAQVVRL